MKSNKKDEEEKKKIKKQNVNPLNPTGVQVINEQIRTGESQTAIYG